jgi:predicted dehydrogenase
MPSSTDRPGRPGRLRVGLIGCGNVALSDHVPAYLSMPDRYALTAIADPTPARLELGGEVSGLGPDGRHADAASLLARSDLDLIDVCTPRISTAIRHRGRSQRSTCCRRSRWRRRRATPGDGRSGRGRGNDPGDHATTCSSRGGPHARLIASGEIGPVEVAILNWLAVLDPGNAAYQPTWRHDSRLAGGGVLMDMLHIVYVAEALLGAPIERVCPPGSPPGPTTHRSRDIALARFETSTNAALVNVGWGVGMGGFGVSGPSAGSR